MRFQSMVSILMIALLVACGSERNAEEQAHAHDEGWAVTSWGGAFEIFAECEPLIAGQVAHSHTHVTILDGFAPLRSGKVSAVLRSSDGTESVFVQDKPTRDGIFSIAIEPATPGDYSLVFRVTSREGSEDVPSGKIRVGTADAPGGLLEAPVAPGHGHSHAGEHSHAEGNSHAETVSFLKEQQWRTEFQTEWATEGGISASVRAPAVVRAASGAEAMLTAPLDGVVSADTRVFVGRDVRRGDVLVSLAPRSSSSITLSELEAETSVARARASRMEDLLKLGAVSQAEVEAARARLASLEPRLAAAKGSTVADLTIRAPFDGRIAEARVTPGGAVNAGDPLVRIVRTPPFWIEAALAPRDVSRLTSPTGLVLQAPGAEAVVVSGAGVKLVSVSPEIDRATGAVTAILEIAQSIPYPLGSLVTAEILLAANTPGVIVPATAIVDDAGTPVVYIQADGESFERREVVVLARQGSAVALEGIHVGERVVVRGGGAIRRASLLSSGEVEGHVH